RVLVPPQEGDAGDEGRRLARAGAQRVAVALVRARDELTGRREVDPASRAREAGVVASHVQRRDADHAVVGRRVGGAVAALAQVARAGDEEGPLGLRALDGAAHGLGVLVGAQAHADDVRAVVGAPGDAQGEVALAADAL